MTALAASLKRMWSAKSRVPHLTGWGTCGSLPNTASRNTTLAGSVYDGVLALSDMARQSAPTVLVIVLNLFR
jgi:hypothetical protein